MSSNTEYTNHLIEQAKQGRKNQFIELSLIFLPQIYSIVFGLVPNLDMSKKICTEVFYIVWKRIKHIEQKSMFETELREIAIVRSFLYLRNTDKIELDKSTIENLLSGTEEFFTEVEYAFLDLTYLQRVILVLNDKLELPVQRISEVLKISNEDKTREELHAGREILLKKFSDGKLSEFPEHGWVILNDCLMKLDKGIDQYLEDEVVEFISEYLQQSKLLLYGIFGKITPDKEFVDDLKKILLKEYSQKKDLKNLDKFSDNYSCVATKSKDVLFEKAFITSKTILPAVKENIAEIAPLKKIKSIFAYLLGFLGIVIIAYFVLNMSTNNWTLKNGEGSYKLNTTLSYIGKLSEDDNILTMNNSKVELESTKSSSIVIHSRSELKFNKIENDYTKLKLLSGTISVNNEGSKTITNDIIIESNEAEIVSANGRINISFSKDVGLEVNVIDGYADIKLDRFAFSLAKNYRFIKNRNKKYSIPVNINTKPQFIELIKNINLLNIDNRKVLEAIKISTRDDYFTLFNLILITDISTRKLLLNRLNTFYPIKLLVNWDKLLNLDKNEILFLKEFLFENL